MKGIIGDLGEMKIPLNLDAKPIKQWPYLLNPQYKEKFKEYLNQMLDEYVIEPLLWKLNPRDRTITLTKLLIKHAKLTPKETEIGT